ncbi:hypothetical protein EKO27_g5832 [Xylaria grammica]|uniref:Fungal N-terminal domain-containing protein n=1 Tax=Xylaria grammica TaxID=363999 RepID=A0A439D4C7_9PEZI|nr:hypothetical protein EKO27_g5832 [Xylaria grammica]
MGDPVGVAGTAVGVVSLGLQLYGGLKQYFDDFNSRDERVAKTLSFLEQLKEALDIINAATRSLRTRQQAPADTVLSCLRSCLGEMQVLQTKMQEFGPSQQINLKGKMKEMKKKLEYPFQISVIEEIGKNLERIMSQLLLTIHGLELHSHLTTSANIDALGDAIKSQTTILSRIESGSDTIHKISNSNSAQLTEINSSVQPLMPMLQSLESVTEEWLGKIENQVHTNHSVTTTRLDVLESGVTEVLSILRHINDQKPSMGQEDTAKYLVGTLVSKPSLLRDVHKSYGFRQDGIESTSNPHTNMSKSSSMALAQAVPMAYTPCRCRQWRRVDERNTRWYAFCFFSKEKTVRTHHPSCSRYPSRVIEHQQTFGVTYYGLRRLLSTAVSVSLSLDYGAGGTSISPTFRCHHVVDKLQSPPFRMIKVLSTALGDLASKTCDGTLAKTITIGCISWINEAYYKRVASPLDVTDDGLTLIDYFDEIMLIYKESIRDSASSLLAIATLFELGVTVSQQRWSSKLSSPGEVMRDVTGYPLPLVLRKTPDLQYAFSANHIDFLFHRDTIKQFDEISDIVELDLDSLCTVLLHQDLNGLSQILINKLKHSVRSGQYGPIKSLMELAVSWPVGLKRILEIEPRFFNSNDMKTLFQMVTLDSRALCERASGLAAICSDCNCSEFAELTEILLEHGCPLTEDDMDEFFRHYGEPSEKTVYAILRHLQVWRKRLRDTLDLYLPIGSQDQSTVHESSLLDYEAACAVKKLQAIGLDPYIMFGLTRGDYRLGSSLNRPHSIFHMIDKVDHAQIAFDLGFRDVDALSEKGTPLSQRIILDEYPSTMEYWIWLIDHGADYTRELPWIIEDGAQRLDNTVELPRYSILHSIFRPSEYYRMYGRDWLDRSVSSILGSPCLPYLAGSSLYDGCSAIDAFSSDIDAISWAIDTFSRAIEHSTLIEAVIRCITFDRLGIRHTCCASINIRDLYKLPADYGSDFDELREEDEDRVNQLNQLVANFIDQYNASNVSLTDFINGPWAEQILRIKLEEASQDWTVEEKSELLAIGVLPKGKTVDAASKSDSRDENKHRGIIRNASRLKPEYWSRQFEIIANGGWSKEEARRDVYEWPIYYKGL